MPLDLTTSLIAFGGVIASAVVAFIVGRSQARAEMERARIETRTMFLGKLYDARLAAYPDLYELLGVLGSRVLAGTATLADVQETWDKVRRWDQRNALLLSPLAIRSAIELRRTLLGLLSLAPEHFSKSRQRKELLPLLIDLQMCLKTELGILDGDSFHRPTKLRSLRQSLQQAAEGGGNVAG